MSRHQWNFELPARSWYSIGQYFTEYPWARKVIVIVVTHENPGGSWLMYCSATSRRKARSPELRSGIFVCARYDASLRMNHLAGTRNALCVPSSVVRAPTTWSWPSSSSTSSGMRWFG